jgi:hypothetical protein
MYQWILLILVSDLQRWFFSNHFTKVDTWGLNVDGAISEHMKVSSAGSQSL